MNSDERWRYVEILSELRANYSCFEENEEPYYKALSVGIKAIREQIAHEANLNKIRAEIDEFEINGHIRDIECFRAGINIALNVINKYKVESEDE